ncbi:hypothetical protein NDU88_004820 [Pleurodeles waltl]|uniref:Uncharacterized protein n=1 Tax=Pleurodeles waltl TaxID=8319 RepID=A0AAV7VHB2_PLEWA|nr:hypothetical protein NDU88_004820 [Pleurodeles waltl]
MPGRPVRITDPQPPPEDPGRCAPPSARPPSSSAVRAEAPAATSSGIVHSRESRVLPQKNRDCRRQPKETGKSRRTVPRKHPKLFGKTRS